MIERNAPGFTEDWVSRRGPPRHVRERCEAMGIDPRTINYREPGTRRYNRSTGKYE